MNIHRSFDILPQNPNTSFYVTHALQHWEKNKIKKEGKMKAKNNKPPVFKIHKSLINKNYFYWKARHISVRNLTISTEQFERGVLQQRRTLRQPAGRELLQAASQMWSGQRAWVSHCTAPHSPQAARLELWHKALLTLEPFHELDIYLFIYYKITRVAIFKELVFLHLWLWDQELNSSPDCP